MEAIDEGAVVSPALSSPTRFTADGRLARLLAAHKLDRYEPVFVTNEVTFETFFTLTLDDLTDLGFVVGPRRQFVNIIKDGPEAAVQLTGMSGGDVANPLTASAALFPFDLSSTSSSTMPSASYPTSIGTPSVCYSAVNGWEIAEDHIELLDVLGKGSFGRVYRAEVKGREVAIKVIYKAETEMTREEGVILRKLSHRNIIRYEGECHISGNYGLVMELCSGGSLYDAIQDVERELSPLNIHEYSTQIANGMNYLHSGAHVSIVHRDLKSMNILFGDPDLTTIKIIDFGLSRDGQGSFEATMGGTPGYLAPEAIRNERVDTSSDVWSFGVIVWELMTRSIPFHGMEVNTVIFGVGQGNLHLPLPEHSDENHCLVELMKSCFKPERKDRPSFKEILALLELMVNESLFTDKVAQLRLQIQRSIPEQLREFTRTVDDQQARESSLRKREKDVMLLERAYWTAELRCLRSLQTWEDAELGHGMFITFSKARYQQHPRSSSRTSSQSSSNMATPATSPAPSSSSSSTTHSSLQLLSSSSTHSSPHARVTTLTVSLELISRRAFDTENVRRLDRNKQMTHWFPLFINPAHAQRALKICKATLQAIECGQPSTEPPENINDTFDPGTALKVLSALMKLMIVNIFQKRDNNFPTLEMYIGLLRWLFYFVQERPTLERLACASVKAFLNEESNRSKKVVPDLGDFLVKLAFVDEVPWEEIAPALVMEWLDRNVRWVAKDHPDILDIHQSEGPLPDELFVRFFNRAKTGAQLILYQKFFAFNIARRSGTTRDQWSREYDQTFGRCPFPMKRSLQEACHEIFNVRSFEDFFERVQFSPLSDTVDLSQVLRNAVANSLRKGYHVKKEIIRATSRERPSTSTTAGASAATTTGGHRGSPSRRSTSDSSRSLHSQRTPRQRKDSGEQ